MLCYEVGFILVGSRAVESLRLFLDISKLVTDKKTLVTVDKGIRGSSYETYCFLYNDVVCNTSKC